MLNTMYNLCRLSKERQEEAAMNGIIPVLQKIVETDRPLKEFALPILCDMAHSGKHCRSKLWQNDGLAFYISLLSDPYWQVTALDAIFVWLQEETASVEETLQQPASIDALVRCFTTSKTNAFENTLEPLQKLLQVSPPIAHAVGCRDFFARIAQKLAHNKAVVRLNLLRILRTICHASEQKEALIREYGMYPIVHRVAEKDPAVLVRNMASELIKACNERAKGSTRNPHRRRSHAIGSQPPGSAQASSSRRHVSSLWGTETPTSTSSTTTTTTADLALLHRSNPRTRTNRSSSNASSPSTASSGPGPSKLPQHLAPPPSRLRLRTSQSSVGLRGVATPPHSQGQGHSQPPPPPPPPNSLGNGVAANGRYRAANNYVPKRRRGTGTEGEGSGVGG